MGAHPGSLTDPVCEPFLSDRQDTGYVTAGAAAAAAVDTAADTSPTSAVRPPLILSVQPPVRRRLLPSVDPA